MPRILIAGCGYVGQATADLFHAAGWTVEGWTRSAESAAKLSAKPYPVYAVDVADRAHVYARAGTFDAVIHCASSGGGGLDAYRQVYLNGARSLLDRFAGSKVLFTSSTSVYAQRDGSWVTEKSETQPARETGRILLETEQLVLAQGGIVARLAGIYGPGRSALLSKFLAGEAIIDLENDRFLNQIHRDDIAAAAQTRMQLIAADVDRVDAPRAAQNQNFGEAAGRGADVEADAPRHVEMKTIERGCKLDAAARHIRMLGLGCDDRGGRDCLRRLAHRHAVGGHQARGNRSLGAGAAIEQAARDQQAICAFSDGHDGRL